MKEYIEILQQLKENLGIPRIDKSSVYDFSIVKQLYDQGLVDATEDKTLGGPALENVSINLAGHEWLESKLKSTKDSSTEDVVDVKPNFFGLGLNLNAAWKKWRK